MSAKTLTKITVTKSALGRKRVILTCTLISELPQMPTFTNILILAIILTSQISARYNMASDKHVYPPEDKEAAPVCICIARPYSIFYCQKLFLRCCCASFSIWLSYCKERFCCRLWHILQVRVKQNFLTRRYLLWHHIIVPFQQLHLNKERSLHGCSRSRHVGSCLILRLQGLLVCLISHCSKPYLHWQLICELVSIGACRSRMSLYQNSAHFETTESRW